MNAAAGASRRAENQIFQDFVKTVKQSSTCSSLSICALSKLFRCRCNQQDVVMNCDYWKALRVSRGQISRLSCWCILCTVMAGLFSGCAGGMSLSGLPSMLSGNRISGQFEPDVDYEAETAARERQSKFDNN